MESGFENGLSCPICFEKYGTPKALPCLHTFCLRCLHELTKAGQGTLRCPVCNSVHTLPANGVDGFSTNYALHDVVQDIQSPKFREVIGRKYKSEEVGEIVNGEVNILKHLVEVVHDPLMQSVEMLKKGAIGQQRERVKLVSRLYDHIIEHAKRERERHIQEIQQNYGVAMKYFDTVQNDILVEKRGIESFCQKACNVSPDQQQCMDLKAFLQTSANYSRGGRKIITDHSHLMWTDIDIVEGKEPVHLIHTKLCAVVHTQQNKRSHRPRIGTMEHEKGTKPPFRRTGRSKSEPHPDAIETACIPRVDRKKLSDPVRNVVDTVLNKLRNNKESNGERRSDMKRPSETTPVRAPLSPPTSAKRSLFIDPPPYHSTTKAKCDEEPVTMKNTRTVEATGGHAHSPRSTRSSSSANSHNSETPLVYVSSKLPRNSTLSAFQSPCGICITGNDELVIADRGTGLVLITYPRSLCVRRSIQPFRGHVDEAKVHALFDVTILSSGDIAVTDSSLKKVIFLKKFNNYAAPEQLWMPHDMVPRGITSDASCIYICDAGNGCVQVYTHTGKHCSSIELDNSMADRCEVVSEVCPQSIAVSPHGHLLVTDIINRCIFLILRTGEISRHTMRFRMNNKIRCSTDPSDAVPRGVCWLDNRYAFIVEDVSQEILLIDIMTETLVRVFKKQEFFMLQGMILDSAGQLLATDIENGRIHVLTRADISAQSSGRAPITRSKSLPTDDNLDTLV